MLHQQPLKLSWDVHRVLRAAAFQPARDPDAVSIEEAQTSESLGRIWEDEFEGAMDVLDTESCTRHHLANIGQSIIYPNMLQSDTNEAFPDGDLSTERGRETIRNAIDKEKSTSKVRAVIQGICRFAKTGPGIFACIYVILVIISGSALVLFLAGWVDHGKNKEYWIEVWSQFINALFTIPGVGLIPWRVRDTYYVIRLAHYQHLTWRLRREQGLPPLSDKHDLPAGDGIVTKAQRLGKEEHDFQNVLNTRQAEKLRYLHVRLHLSHPWYRPHSSWTHDAFPLGVAMLIVFFFDLNSIFQCLLCAAMWGYATHYRDRPAWMTAVLIVCSFMCGIIAGVLIAWGTERSKRKQAVRNMLFQPGAPLRKLEPTALQSTLKSTKEG